MVAVLLAGCVVAYPVLNPAIVNLCYLCTIKYAFAAIMLHFFKRNPKTMKDGWDIMVEQALHVLQIDSPPSVWGNVLALVGAYVIFLLGGFLCLKYMYKEKR